MLNKHKYSTMLYMVIFIIYIFASSNTKIIKL